jgi:peptide/nickel transport system permease protein
MTTTRSLPGIAPAPHRAPSATARIVAGIHKSRLVVRGVPIFSLLVVAVTVVCALFAPALAPDDPIKTNPAQALSAPSFSGHVLGTDHLGRDILSRLIYGARISVTVGFLAVFVAGAVGTAIALISAVFRGWADRVLMQITDAFLALPYLMIAVTVISILKPSLMVVILVIGLLRWMDYARVLRGEVLRLAATDFVQLAIVAGCSRWRIIGRHISPNMINTLLILATLGIGSAVIAEATLSFLGLGIPRPQPSWGVMLAESQKYLYAAWWLPLIPGVAISLLVMASNLVGDWLRDRFDLTRCQL